MADPKAFPKNTPVNRLKGTLPKVGIRPTIDGRHGGVRESLEDVVMALAVTVAKFISANLKYSCGLPVECVIADGCIGGLAEAATCAEKFTREGVGLTITVTNCWCYGSETMDMDPLTPKAVWGFNGTQRPGAVYLAAVLAAHAQKGLPAFGIYGHDVKDLEDTKDIPCDVQEKLLRFARAGLAVATMRGKSYLSMGGTSMGIAGSIVSPDFLEKYLGIRVESIDLSEFVRRWEEGIFDPVEYEKALQWTQNNVNFGWDPNPIEEQHTPERKQWVLETCVKMALIARDLMVGNPRLKELGFAEEAMGHNAIAAGFQGQRQWTDHFPNGDFLESLLSSSFDWTGVREPHVVATENDHLNGVTMLFGKLLTNRAQCFADVRTYWSPDAIARVTGWKPQGAAQGGVIHLINSGAVALDATFACQADGKPVIKPWWEVSSEEAAKMLEETNYCYGSLGYFRGGGYSSNLNSRGGVPVTMARLNLVAGLGPVLQLAEGWTVELPEAVHKVLCDRTDPTWPTTWFAPRVTGEGPFRDVYSVMNNWGANHGVFSYGHIGADLIALAALLRIPVNMHNVADQDIYRPHVWASFGTKDLEGADYRACASFGPLYGRK